MKVIVLFTVLATAYAGVVQQQYGVAAPAAVAVAAAPAVAAVPQQYSHSIQAAAIRNVETVGVTKTITPVVTKTTTTRVHSEPAVSVGYVQGYTQSAQGAPQVVPVQYNTQYTSYLNPTVGLNGPVTYAGPAVQTGVAVAAQPVAAYAAAQPVAATYAAAPVAASYAAAPVAYSAAGLYQVQPAYASLQAQQYAVQPQQYAQVAAFQPQQYAQVQQHAVQYAAPAIAHSKY